MMGLQTPVLVVVPPSANPQLDGKHSQKLGVAFVCQLVVLLWCWQEWATEILVCSWSSGVCVGWPQLPDGGAAVPGERGAVVALLCLGLCAFNLLQAIMYKVTGTSEKIFTKMWEKLILSWNVEIDCHKTIPVNLKLKDLGVFGWAVHVSRCDGLSFPSVPIDVFVRCWQKTLDRLLLNWEDGHRVSQCCCKSKWKVTRLWIFSLCKRPCTGQLNWRIYFVFLWRE